MLKGRMFFMKKLKRSFYEKSAVDVGKKLLGKILIHKYKDIVFKGRIVETEAYIGHMDKAAHSYNNRRTKRTEIMFGPAGYAYIYLIYGMYYCMNVVTGIEGDGSAVLIRGVEPIESLEDISMNRYGKGYEVLTKKEKINLTNGPGKLCNAFHITKENNGDDLLEDKIFICEDPYVESFEIGISKRINIDYAEEARDFEWRFFIENNPYVSR